MERKPFPDHLVDEWHPTLNGDLSPSDFSGGSNVQVWWMGNNCKHEWKAKITKRTTGGGCPYCSGQQVLAGFNDLSTKNPDLAQQWHPTLNGTLNPNQLTVSSGRKIWWVCQQKHGWEASVYSRTNGNGCPYCAGKKVLKGYNDLASQNPTLTDQWHPTKNAPLLPNLFTTRADKKIWWICQEKHEWEANINSRSRGNGCPECNARSISKAEKEIANYLQANDIAIIQSDRKLLKGSELDIYLPDHNLAIEYNGIYWHNEMNSRHNHAHQHKWYNTHNLNIQLIQIWEDDWNKRPDQIKVMLLNRVAARSQKVNLQTVETYVSPLTQKDTKAFFKDWAVNDYVSTPIHLGLRNQITDELLSVLTFVKDVRNPTILHIGQYVEKTYVAGGFTQLLDYAEQLFKPIQIVAVTDNCVNDGYLYADNGFTLTEETDPDYRYVIRAKRVPRKSYSLARFKDDPKLKWEKGLTELQLADLNKMDRIWDAGKTRWVKICEP